jgi:short subunit dehydrogenase-like uncharacterized protein
MPDAARPYDIVFFGATGFTGRLVAERTLERYGVGRGLRWAIAGRSREKLESLRAALAAADPGAGALPLLAADVGDRASLDAVAAQTRVVCSTVGPYALYGKAVVEACVEHGTAYCDLTGEPQFVREMIDRHHARAVQTGARIVHCCGFDSVPFDLGVLMVAEAMREWHGVRCVEVKAFAGEQAGGVSGGTIASMLNAIEEASRDRRVQRLLGDPYALTPGERGPDGPDQRGVRFDRDLRRWTAPWVMAPINTRVVRRSNMLLGYPWGRDFRYSEVSGMPAGLKGLAGGLALSVGLGAFVTLAALPPTRAVLRRFLPKPGQGPSREQREKGFFKVRLLGFGEHALGSAPRKLLGLVAGASDPGYGETVKMLSESAVCLATDRLATGGGVLTPASSMGTTLLERLRASGMTWEVRPF